MKNWKKLLACLLAGVLTLTVLTACNGGTGSMPSAGAGTTYTSAENGKALADALELTYSTSLQSTAKSIADWVANSTALRSDGTVLVRRVALDTENAGYWEQGDLSGFLFSSNCYAAGDATITIGMESAGGSTAVDLSIPAANGAEPQLLTYATGKTEMGAAYLTYAGITYVVAVFR